MSNETRPELKKVLRSIDIFATGFGALIGWGWIVLWGDYIYSAGALMTFIGWIIAGILIIFVGLVYGELTSSMPVAGGEVAFTFRGFGTNVSYLTGWFMAVAYIALLMFEGASLPHVFAYLFPSYFKVISMYTIAGYNVYLPMVLLGVILGTIWTYINYIGAKPYGWVMSLMVLLFAIIGFSTFILAIIYGFTSSPAITNFHNNLFGTLPPLSGLIMILGVAGFFYIGFDMIPQASEEFKLESKKLARLIILSIVMGTIWYLLVTIMDGFLLPREMIPNLDLPTADAVKLAWGPVGEYVIVFVGIFGIITTYAASFFAAARVLFSLGRAKLLPKWFAEVHPKYRTPHNAILFTGILAIISPLFGRRSLIWFVDATSAYVALLYLMVSLAFIKLRKNEPNMNRPYKAPGGIISGILGAIASTILFLSVIVPGAPSALIWPYEYAIFLIFLVLGVAFYIMAPTKRISKDEIEYLILGEYRRIYQK
ncbi:MAG: APC family permease [Thermoprotei archaeon]|jgi:amino acid transporter